MAVVAIVAVLLGLAVPNAIAYSRKLRLTELDDGARGIYMAAQNKLMSMKSAGEDLSKLSTHEPNKDGYYVILSEDPAISTLLPAGSADAKLLEKHYAVEFDPVTGKVYAVWISDDVLDYSKAYSTLSPDRTARLRAGANVGYYGG